MFKDLSNSPLAPPGSLFRKAKLFYGIALRCKLSDPIVAPPGEAALARLSELKRDALDHRAGASKLIEFQ
jgi:hypothetical protein